MNKKMMNLMAALAVLSLSACNNSFKLEGVATESLAQAFQDDQKVSIQVIQLDSFGSDAGHTNLSNGAELGISDVEGFNVEVNISNLDFDEMRFDLGIFGSEIATDPPFTACGHGPSNLKNCRVAKAMRSGQARISARAYKRGAAVSAAIQFTLNLGSAQVSNPPAPMPTPVSMVPEATSPTLPEATPPTLPEATQPSPSEASSSAGMNPWIKSNFATVPVTKGNFTSRTSVEAPALVQDATGTNSKYAFAPVNTKAPNDLRMAFVNVSIKNLKSTDAFGGGIGTSRSYPGMVLFMSNVYIEPNWPAWKDYSSTNYDGMVLDGATEIYAEDLTIKNWNADAAIDIKPDRAQFVRLKTEGQGHRTLRFWGTGPHYIVDSSINNTGAVGEGSLIWMKDCTNTKVYIYNSKFNGAASVPSNKVSCDGGSSPKFIYLVKDPRTTGEMHPMFTGR